MNHRRRPGSGLDDHDDQDELLHEEPDELLHHERGLAAERPRVSLSDVFERVRRWYMGPDPDEDDVDDLAEHEGVVAAEPPAIEDDELEAEPGDEPEDELFSGRAPTRFPLTRFGYDRGTVDEHLAELERELAFRRRELADRERELVQARAVPKPPMSITEEIERIGEQTASILVVAHDQANETTRRAEEQAERCIADAAANAVAITAEAKQRLHELDDETDSVWHERERLLEDVRTVSVALASLADEAGHRFPPEERDGQPAGSLAGAAALPRMQRRLKDPPEMPGISIPAAAPPTEDPQSTQEWNGLPDPE
ncbi:MAG: DivIVA domain-containing protein [Solirubrobacterales bacterium]|nr:DivIVA domain-containing protein [Solirubrobacterales bacterium]